MTDTTLNMPASQSFGLIALKPSADPHAQLVTNVEKWVAQSFYGTMLQQMRNSAFKSDLFSGGRGGDTFGELYDQQLTDRMSRGAGAKLVRAIVRRIEAKTAYEKQSIPDPKWDAQKRQAEALTLKLAA